MKRLDLIKEEIKDWIDRNSKKKYIRMVMQDTDWSEEKTKEEMKKAAQMGFTYGYYAKRKLWAKTPEQLEKHAAYWKEKQGQQQEEKQADLAYIMEQTGWSKNKTIEKVRQAYHLCGASLYDYTLFKMWDLTEEQQKTIYTKAVFDQLFEKYNTDPLSIQTLV